MPYRLNKWCRDSFESEWPEILVIWDQKDHDSVGALIEASKILVNDDLSPKKLETMFWLIGTLVEEIEIERKLNR